ncbi:transcriptional regulator [Actinoplanes sp. ATCC 53533]|uniref:BTAD domain-containing putative transcriptional regulator n=1 Tax=Actinoplanes sp. ATCC 53533 TaxID=1288362 RepID=UPI000F7A65F5|nr:BTAD domain-containing putative transcriptional regulator [Actinoplanes sp. ATCC 53533]RSM72541.1 transcriptional regulator [Actinoplanes sp. ATCC 53533]
MDGDGLRVQILGPLRLWRDGVELDAGPPQQAYLLAVLLTRAGQPISTSELIDLVWGDDVPASAVNILQKYVGSLRRLLEPTVPARESGTYLQRRGSGYLFVAEPGVLDVVRFRQLVEAGRSHRQPGVALDHYVRALGLWHGPAGDGLAARSSADFTALNIEFLGACVAAAELAVAQGRPDLVLPALQRAAGMAPLDERVQAALVTVLAAAGQQATALSVFQTVRARLVDELGIDPGPALSSAHRRLLAQPPAPAAPVGPMTGPPADPIVGRAEELAILRQAVRSTFAGGSGLVVLEGEPGVGKTRLLEQAGVEAEQGGALVVWGRCVEGDGAPSMWPWVEVFGTLVESLPAGMRQEWRAGELGRLVGSPGEVPGMPVLPDSGARFRLFEQAVALVAQISARRALLLLIDDLQWADVASLDLLGHLAARLPGATAVIGALRDRAPVPRREVAHALAVASRQPRLRRIHLGAFSQAEVAELVRRETGQALSAAAARSTHARTGGNAFYVRELSRYLRDGGRLTDVAARAGVPSTVRDVVRDRVAGLDEVTTGLLQLAALIGRDFDLSLLASAAGLDVQTCLDHLGPLEALGLVEPVGGNPFSFRFSHDLVRESVAVTTPSPRVPGLHRRLAEAIENTVTDDDAMVERLAHHLWAAGPLADPSWTAAALLSAGRCAGNKSALEAAARQLRLAAQVARGAGLVELELSALSLFIAVDGMRAGYVGSALDLLERAEHLARDLGRERDAADFLFSRWAAYSQGIQLERAGRLARRLLEQGEASADPIVRAYGRHAWGIHNWDIGNITESYRYLSRSDAAVPQDQARREQAPLRHDLQLLSPVMLGLMTALRGDVAGAREVLDAVEAAAGDDPYAITVWSAFSVTVAALAGDPAWARRAAERGIAQDPDFSFVFLGGYQRLARCWARAVTDRDPAAAAEAEKLIAVALLDPPRSGLATWSGLLGEMWLRAGRLEDAAEALDRADSFVATYGQRYAEGLLLLLRARLMRARGEPVAEVRAAAERARELSTERGAHLFARRAQELL